ncbi:hypothetical protein 15570_00039 [Lokiarchaeota virus WyrdV1]|nr:hypothetical protein 15570_00039 [Lokiarchaeota virus WyrdV1]
MLAKITKTSNQIDFIFECNFTNFLKRLQLNLALLKERKEVKRIIPLFLYPIKRFDIQKSENSLFLVSIIQRTPYRITSDLICRLGIIAKWFLLFCYCSGLNNHITKA